MSRDCTAVSSYAHVKHASDQVFGEVGREGCGGGGGGDASVGGGDVEQMIFTKCDFVFNIAVNWVV